MNWNKIKAFYHAANAGSFSEAGRRLFISQSAISRSIIDLEDRLGTKVFHRGSRGIKLTTQGKVLYDLAHRMFMELEGAKKVFAGQEDEPKGELKVKINPILSTSWLMHFLPKFAEQYPDIKLFIAEGCKHDNDEGGDAELTIDIVKSSEPNLLQRPIGKLHFGLYVGQKYLDQFGEPTTVEDLRNHRLITIGEDRFNLSNNMDWMLYAGLKDEEMRKPYMLVQSATALYRAAKAGLGIVPLAAEDPRLEQANLVEILPEISGPVVEIYCSYPEHLKHSKRIKALENFLLDAHTEIKLQ